MSRRMLYSGIGAVVSGSMMLSRFASESLGWGVVWLTLAMFQFWVFLEEARKSDRPFWIGFYDGISLGPLRRFIAKLMR